MNKKLLLWKQVQEREFGSSDAPCAHCATTVCIEHHHFLLPSLCLVSFGA